MPDIGFMELLVIGVVALIVVGPKDLPGMFRTVGKYVGKAKGMAREFQRSMEAAADESGLKDAADSFKDLNNMRNFDGGKEIKKKFNDIVEARETGVPLKDEPAESASDDEAEADMAAATKELMDEAPEPAEKPIA